MQENELNTLQCEQVKNYIKNLIDEIPCEKIISSESFSKGILVKPITYLQALNNRIALQIYFGNDFSYSFYVKKAQMNKMIVENDKLYMHIFFVNEVITGTNKLNIVFRFSNLSDFNASINLGLDEIAYSLQNGNVTQFNNTSPQFSVLRTQFLSGIGLQASKPNTILTEYITYEMEELKKFGGFEHDLVFELMCTTVNGQNRLGLQVFINDSNRVHPNLTNMGYYDLGNIRPIT